ncbi:hypothetical protein GCM10011415_01350 [Salipiger pallidus]|uniref:Uncharacterized protein n=1 Tax=Salipiger pallidus TaxID=1775170 RepID=A0A8J2ZGD4_9RHOB|nr:hypothetical protein [Salipiger pallidus]GGG59265.1 hypothetical protein GCM10011415_01350 [Salipiger pallidus]
MALPTYPYAGLHLGQNGDINLLACLTAAAEVLRRLDGYSGRPLQTSRKRPALMGDRVGLVLRPGSASSGMDDSGVRKLEIRVISREAGPAEDDLVTSLLAETVLTLMDEVEVDIVEWLSPDCMIEADEFVDLLFPDEQEFIDTPSAAVCKPEYDHDEDARLAQSIRSAICAAEHIAPLADHPSRITSGADRANGAKTDDAPACRINRDIYDAPGTTRSTVPDPEPRDDEDDPHGDIEDALPRRSAMLGAMGMIVAVFGYSVRLIGMACLWLMRAIDLRLLSRALSVGMALIALTNSDALWAMVEGALK